jgi:hypothetical protein
MEMLIEAGFVSNDELDKLISEANELVAIFTASVKTARSNLPKK